MLDKERRSNMPTELEENELYRVRFEKLQDLRSAGIEPFPLSFERTHTSQEILLNSDAIGTEVSVAGRLMTIRKMGKSAFAHIQDETGKIQVYLRVDVAGEEAMKLFDKSFDLGDIIGVSGEVFKTRTDETTVEVKQLTLLSKALRQPPSKFHGLKDPETTYRQRYLDLLANSESRERFRTRAKIVKSIRGFLDANGFEEVETPILQAEASGASARPFVTHHNALDEDFYLRIAPETYLKRLLVGGYGKVYEIGKCFRNEGIDPSHLQDFTMLEFYAAYWDASRNLKFTSELLQTVLREGVGRDSIKIGETDINLTLEWPIRTYREVLLEHSGVDLYNTSSVDELRQSMRDQNIIIPGMDKMNFGQLVDKLFKTTTRPKLITPQFIREYPAPLSPLARNVEGRPGFVDQFQLLLGGWEIVKGYSELIDPLEQRRRLVEQSRLKLEGDDEAMPLDEDYIKAMEYGMPPNSGVGIGIDRLTAILTEAETIRDVVLFPLIHRK